jgi:foldase protein PrsA
MFARVRTIALFVVCAAACGSGSSAGSRSAEPGTSAGLRASEVLARVNGVPITADEVAAENVNGASVTGKALLLAVVQKELAAQRAEALGLSADAEYRRELERKQAEVTVWKRKQLSALLYRREVQAKSSVSDDEVQQYFDANRARIRQELHLLQIFTRDRGRIDGALRDLQGGREFTDVARELWQDRVPGKTPWDLGFQRFAQMPGAWLDVAYALQPGAHSGVIEGSNHRYWILQLVDKRETDTGLEQVREPIRTLLQGQKLEQMGRALETALLEKASIVYTPQSAAQ